MSKFKVGEICIAIGFCKADGTKYIGTECEVQAVGEFLSVSGIWFEYAVRLHDGKVKGAHESDLKKLPPKDTIISMEKLNEIFTPEKAKA